MENKNYTLITGACGGLGQEFVKACAKNNENLVLIGTSQGRLDKLSQSLLSEFKGIELLTFELNLADEKKRKELVEKLNKENICVTKLINNAGVIIEGDLLRFSDEEILNAVKVNCEGTLDLTQKLIKARDESQKFEVLTVASLASSYPMPHMAVYAATKSFLVSMMTALSVEFKGKNVFFTTICPGAIATTDAMKASIKSMGLGGKLSCTKTEKVANIGLKALKKHKKIVIPGKFNRFLVVITKPFSKVFLAKKVGNIWKKSQKKRGF